MADKYTADSKLEEVLKTPETSAIIDKFQLPCLHCAMAAYEAKILTLGQIAKTYGIDLDGMLKELNELG
ncbi:MAG TPA: disulfide oxidoreductase [Actinobacteria bacterium]|nr:disulfide oxidoreductase [Actinomycetota bacterium]